MKWWQVVLLLTIITVILMAVGTTLVGMEYKKQKGYPAALPGTNGPAGNRTGFNTCRYHFPERHSAHYGVWDGWGFFLKMFLPLYVAVAVAILAFFIKPTDTDPRFGLGVGALFAAVANSYINSSMLPNTGVMSLADIICIIGTITILLTLIESTISLHLYDRKDKKSFPIVSTGFRFMYYCLGILRSTCHC